MELNCIPVAYFDEGGVWNYVGKEILVRLPLQNVVLKHQESKTLEKLEVNIIPHADASWDSRPENSYLKPYLWVYVLICESYDIYKREKKHILREWINTMSEQRVEWLVLYIPGLFNLTRTHKHFNKVYDKIASDLHSMSGYRKCYRLYSHSTRTFLDLKDSEGEEYWVDFMNGLSEGVANGIEERILVYYEYLSRLELDPDFYKYCLIKEAMAMIFSSIGLHAEALECYDSLLNPPPDYFPCEFVPLSDHDLRGAAPLNVDAFRNSMETGSLSELSFKEYIFSKQKKELEQMGEYKLIGELSLKLISTCIRLFSSLPEDLQVKHESSWVYKTALPLATYLQNCMDFIDIQEPPDAQIKAKLHYSIGLLFALARSRLEKLGGSELGYGKLVENASIELAVERSPVKAEGQTRVPQVTAPETPEIPGHGGDLPLSETSSAAEMELNLETVLSSRSRYDETMMYLTNSLFEEFNLSNHFKIAKRYKSEYGMMLAGKGHYEQAVRVLVGVEFEEWGQLEVMVQLHLLQCYIAVNNHPQALQTALNICRFPGVLPPNQMSRVLMCLDEMASDSSGITLPCSGVFDARLIFSRHGEKLGNWLTATAIIQSRLPCFLDFKRIYTTLCNEYGREVQLSAEDVKLFPGPNTLCLTGLVSNSGKLSTYRLSVQIKELTLQVEIPPVCINVEESEKSVTLKHKMPSLLVVNQVQLFAVEISTRQETLKNLELEIQESRDLVVKNKAQGLLYEGDKKQNIEFKFHNNVIKIPELKMNCRIFVILELFAAVNGEAVMETQTSFSSVSRLSTLNTSVSDETRHTLSRKLSPFTEIFNVRTPLRFERKGLFSEETCSSDMEIIQPLNVTSCLLKGKETHLLKLKVVNCAHTGLVLRNWNFKGCFAAEDPNLCEVNLRTGQILHMAFKVCLESNSEACIELLYSCSSVRTGDHRVHIEPSVDNKMRFQLFSYKHFLLKEHKAVIRHNGSGLMGENYLVYLSSFKEGETKVRVETSGSWEVPKPFSGEVQGELEVVLKPLRAGPLELPNIYVWVEGFQLSLQGTKSVFVYPKLEQT